MLDISKYAVGNEGWFGGNRFSKIKYIYQLDEQFKNKKWLNEIDFKDIKIKISGDIQASMLARKGVVVEDIFKAIKEDFDYVKNAFNKAKKDTKEFHDHYTNFFNNLSKNTDANKILELLKNEYKNIKKTPKENILKPNHILLGNKDIPSNNLELCKAIANVYRLPGYIPDAEVNIKDKNELSSLYDIYKELFSIKKEIENLENSGFGSFDSKKLEKYNTNKIIKDEDVHEWFYDTFISEIGDLNSSAVFIFLERRVELMTEICNSLITKTLHKI